MFERPTIAFCLRVFHTRFNFHYNNPSAEAARPASAGREAGVWRAARECPRATRCEYVHVELEAGALVRRILYILV